MDPEKVKKISEMAIELQKKGMANSKEEALKQAENIFSNEEDLEVSELPNEGDDNEKDESEEVGIKDLKKAMTKNTKYMVKLVNEFKEELSGMKEEIDNLKKGMNKIAGQVKNISQNAVEKEKEEKQERIKEKKENAKEKDNGKKDHPRQGKYTEEDVAIDDVFYYGNK